MHITRALGNRSRSIALIFACASLFGQAFDKRDAMIPMRDGIKLHTEIWMPQGAHEALPFILERSPYGWARAKLSIEQSFLVDDPEFPIGELIAITDRFPKMTPDEQKAEIAKFTESHGRPHQRLYLGRADDRSVALKFKDVEGRDRTVIQVAAHGSPVIRFLDQKGAVISELPGQPKQ